MSKYKVVIDENSNYYEAVNYSFDNNICVLNNNSDLKKLELFVKD